VSAGVAFVINKALIAHSELMTYELIEGHALAIKVKWHENKETVLINIYAPNNKSDHQPFWEQIDTKRRSKGVRKPNFMLGDFNLTEDTIDRSPPHQDDMNAIEALRNLHQNLEIQDTWRHAFPSEHAFTFRANNNGTHRKSRLDRIYTSIEAAKLTFQWKMCYTSVLTDHWLVSMKYAPIETLTIGKGRWTWLLSSLKDQALLEKLEKRGIVFMGDLERLQRERTTRETDNPQTLWNSFKSDIRKIAKAHCRESWSKLTS